MRWHLHVTVQPHWSWTLTDVASALARDVERHDVHPVVITNHFRDPARPPYREMIPTAHHEGDEASAARRIFSLGVLLNNAGWRVKRLKIEGDPTNEDVARRALYFETHIKCQQAPAPLSTNARGDRIFTVRRQYITDVDDEIAHWRDMCVVDPFIQYKVEAAVLDTNPGMDEEWLRS